MKANIDYFFTSPEGLSEVGTYAVVEGGVRVVDAEGYSAGEFIAAEDFVDDAFVAVHYPMEVDFSNAWSLRQATEEISLEAAAAGTSWAVHHAAVIAMVGE